MKRELPPSYYAAAERLYQIVRDVAAAHGPPSFMMPPDGVLVPAPLDVVGKPLALNAAAREVVARAEYEHTLMMLPPVLELLGIPFRRAPTIRAFADLLDDCGLLVGVAQTGEGEAQLRAALKPSPKG